MALCYSSNKSSFPLLAYSSASFPDIDFDEVIKEVAEELEIPFGQIKFNRFDGTVENILDEMTRTWMTV